MRKTGAWLLIFLLLASGLAGFMVFKPSKAQEYPRHVPIDIDGNEEFAEWAANHSWPGDGTEGDPYVIEELDFNISYRDRWGIQISNTDIHFIVRNVTIFPDLYSFWEGGIALYNVTNSKIDEVTISDLYESFEIVECFNIAISNCELSSNYRGIEIRDSINITLTNNIFGENGVNINGNTLEHFNSHIITSDNLINGTPLFYYKNCKDIEIKDIPVGQLIFANCTNVKAVNITIANTHDGIQMAYVKDAHIAGNELFLNRDNGMEIRYSYNLSVIENEVVSNLDGGIYILESDYITLNGNIVSSNRWTGIEINGVTNITIINNNISSNQWDGLDIYNLNDATISDNIIFQNDGHGISLGGGANITISDNEISSQPRLEFEANNGSYETSGSSNEQYGIELYSSWNTTIKGNSFNSNGITIEGEIYWPYYYSDLYEYLELFNSINITTDNFVNGKPIYYYKNLKGMELEGGSMGQLILVNCTNVSMSNLDITNTDIGVQMSFVNNSTIDSSNIKFNNIDGINIVESSHIDIIYCNVSYNFDGIGLSRSKNISFMYNVISNHESGIDSSYSSNITIDSNFISCSGKDDDYTYRSDENSATRFYLSQNITIESNTLSKNNYGVYIKTGSYSIIKNNIFVNTTYGINIETSSEVSIIENNIFPTQDGVKIMKCFNTIIAENYVVLGTLYSGLILELSDFCHVINNTISNGDYGLKVWDSDDMTIAGNTVQNSWKGMILKNIQKSIIMENYLINNRFGCCLDNSDDNEIIGNHMSDNNRGFYLYWSDNNIITENNISFNYNGIWLEGGVNNLYHNNIIKNNSVQLHNENAHGYWNDSQGQGNNWSDYSGYDMDGDGVGDTHLPHLGVDYFPLTKNVGDPLKEDSEDDGFSIPFDPLVLLSVVLGVVFLILIFDIYFRIKRVVRSSKENDSPKEPTPPPPPGQ